MQVSLRRRNAAVTEHLADENDIPCPIEHVCRERMTCGIATLMSPVDTTVTFQYAIGSAPAQQFNGATGEAIDLGKWRIDKGENMVTANGSTTPPRPSSSLTVEFDASVA